MNVMKELIDTKVNACVRGEAGYCSIRWEALGADFDVGQLPNANTSGVGDMNCKSDYVILPSGSDVTGTLGPSDRFCGSVLNPVQASFFTLLRFVNTPCVGSNGLEGVCMSDTACSIRGGASIGSCASGSGVCCLDKMTCGNTTFRNETLFVNPSFPFYGEDGTNTCQMTIKNINNICQMRLDFLEFNIAQPDRNGRCTTDSFIVGSSIGERYPILCGENSGQHMYIDMGRSRSSNPIVLSVITNGNKMTRTWRIKISMIRCKSLELAPTGCLQYYQKPSDVVRSFNWGLPTIGNVRYLSNLRYTVCLRVEENFCSIKWETETPESFSWGWPFDEGSMGFVCNNDDFIEISQGSPSGLRVGEDRFCGNSLLNRNIIISHVKPFVLRVRSNDNSVLNSRASQTGFSLIYTQLPCIF
ncbi:uncharacterized protein LOC106459893 [Limulus polyphemus]|uniref:Uncharacterized protein LOC106459893 n=1 Tax=Limulus polyphemus TaxID=6850 RepID=A0ABM1B546_LIMPO|nr:uncharacterized protein LOC106459893 [Limulus polyphemus]